MSKSLIKGNNKCNKNNSHVFKVPDSLRHTWTMVFTTEAKRNHTAQAFLQF